MIYRGEFDRLGKKWLIPAAVISIAYWLWYGLLVGIEAKVFIFYFGFLSLYFFSAQSRKLAIGFAPLFIYLFLYNSLTILHKFNTFPVHIEDLYMLEKRLFGVRYNGVLITVCEFFNDQNSVLLDALTGAFYITWAPFPILFGLFLFIKGENILLFNFWLCFLIANIFGFLGYIIYPAAPPWYYFEYGNQLIIDLENNAAGLVRFDELIGLPIYKNMYAQGTNTFGAMPSMHAAFPLILVYYARKYGNHLLTTVFFISMIAIWFAAIYSSHHYIIDVVVGAICAVVAIIIMELIVNRKFVVKWYQNTVIYLSAGTKN